MTRVTFEPNAGPTSRVDDRDGQNTAWCRRPSTRLVGPALGSNVTRIIVNDGRSKFMRNGTAKIPMLHQTYVRTRRVQFGRFVVVFRFLQWDKVRFHKIHCLCGAVLYLWEVFFLFHPMIMLTNSVSSWSKKRKRFGGLCTTLSHLSVWIHGFISFELRFAFCHVCGCQQVVFIMFHPMSMFHKLHHFLIKAKKEFGWDLQRFITFLWANGSMWLFWSG